MAASDSGLLYLVEGGSASKHGVFKVRTEADAVCSTLNAEHPRQLAVRDAALYGTYELVQLIYL